MIVVTPMMVHSCFQISDYHFLPDTAKMAERVKPCLQESEELPRDFTALFDRSLFKLDTEVLPDALKYVGSSM